VQSARTPGNADSGTVVVGAVVDGGSVVVDGDTAVVGGDTTVVVDDVDG
jgi:hypothetical protein